MDAAAEEVVIPFLIGAVLGGTVMTLVVGALASGVIDGAQREGYAAGWRTARNELHGRGRRDLEGDAATELGRYRA